MMGIIEANGLSISGNIILRYLIKITLFLIVFVGPAQQQ